MKKYRANIKIRLGSVLTNTWIEIEAPTQNVAKALLEAQYGSGMVICILPC